MLNGARARARACAARARGRARCRGRGRARRGRVARAVTSTSPAPGGGGGDAVELAPGARDRAPRRPHALRPSGTAQSPPSRYLADDATPRPSGRRRRRRRARRRERGAARACTSRLRVAPRPPAAAGAGAAGRGGRGARGRRRGRWRRRAAGRSASPWEPSTPAATAPRRAASMSLRCARKTTSRGGGEEGIGARNSSKNTWKIAQNVCFGFNFQVSVSARGRCLSRRDLATHGLVRHSHTARTSAT